MTHKPFSPHSARLSQMSCLQRSNLRGAFKPLRALFIRRSADHSLGGYGEACGHPQTTAMPPHPIPARDLAEDAIDALSKLATCILIGLVLSITTLAIKNGALLVEQAQHESW